MSTPYGAWPSTITTDMVVGATRGLSSPTITKGGRIRWIENRPSEGGRAALVERGPAGAPLDLVADPFSVRTLVHEYGGVAYSPLGEDTVVASGFTDQRLYRIDDGGEPVPLTAAPTRPRGDRYADGRCTPDGRWLVAVQERHDDSGVVNRIVAVGLADGIEGEVRVLAEGSDFAAAPRPSPDGGWLAWLTWDHPRMPWDGTELWVAPLGDGAIGSPARVAGGPDESVFQPEWSPGGALHFVSDRSGWWNLHRMALGDTSGATVTAVHPADAEFGQPLWGLGASTYGFLDDGRIVCTWTQGGFARLGVLEDGDLRDLDLPFSTYGGVQTNGTTVVAVVGSPDAPAAVVAIDPASAEVDVIRRSTDDHIDPALVSTPEAISFPTGDGAEAHALLYRPVNPAVTRHESERPPLLVLSHGGPTSQTLPALDLNIQFFTSRGFAVAHVNYRGSTGYGRAYRDALKGQWGLADVEDCVAVVRHLGGAGEIDPSRAAIRGGSAGGYTTLCALTFTDVFAAGASYYGVADAAALARDTHKFESRYLDSLIGPWPEAEDVYIERSPVHHLEHLRSPVVLFQGLDDLVVPPSQSEQMVAALRQRGVPHAYVAFEGEAHGFRKAATIARCLDAELSFYGQVLGFTPAGDVEPIGLVTGP